MAREVIYKCDLCNEVRKETNHWFVVAESFSDYGNREYHISKFSPKVFANYEFIFCGEAHTLQFIARLLQNMQKVDTSVEIRCVHCSSPLKWDINNENWVHEFPDGNISYSCYCAVDDESRKYKIATPPKGTPIPPGA